MQGKFMNAKFSSRCPETGNSINKRDSIFYSFTTKQAFCEASTRYQSEIENQSTSNLIQAQEDSYFDSFCQNNNI